MNSSSLKLVEGYASQNPSYKKKVVFDLLTSESESQTESQIQPIILDELFNKMNQLEEKIDKLMNMVSAYIPKDEVRIFRNINELLRDDEDPIL